MKEILFQGISIKSDEWVEGFYLEVMHHDDASHVHPFIMVRDKCIDTGVPAGQEAELMVEVYPDSVSQYINVVNKPTGKKLFEGDILQYFDNEVQIIEWNDEWNKTLLHSYSVRTEKKGKKFVASISEGWNDLDDYELADMKYIGNIKDDPQSVKILLEKMCKAEIEKKEQLEAIYNSRKNSK